MKVCVVGAGAVGGHLAARLYASETEVSVVARGTNLEAIKGRGIVLRDPHQELRIPVRVTSDPQEVGIQDAVIFAVKAPDLPVAVNSARPLFSSDTRAVFVVNGIPWWYEREDGSNKASSDADQIASIIAPEQTIGSVFYSLCSVPEPGVINVRNPVSRLCLGDVSPGEPSAVTLRLAAAFRSSAVNAEVSTNIRDQVWEKLILLLATCPLSVLAQAAPIDIFKDSVCTEMSKALIGEATAIATALGRSVKIDADAIIASSRSSQHRPSILQDLDAGRKMEIDALFTAPLKMARAAGVRMPTLEMLTALIRIRAHVAGLY